MKTILHLAVVVAGTTFALGGRGAETKESPHAPADMSRTIFTNYADLKWDKILPDLGDNSPEISILHIDPKTKATKLMIRAPRAIHVRKHWHSANETHTVIFGTQVVSSSSVSASIVYWYCALLCRPPSPGPPAP